ncbi:cyclase family protein [bacterium]|nr:cyclase family protein [bacterium]
MQFAKSMKNLTHPIIPDMPEWSGDPQTFRTLAAEITSDGFALNEWRVGEHTGTHLGSPSHFLKGEATIDQFPQDLFCCTAAILRFEHLPYPLPLNYTVSIEDILKDEELHGLLSEYQCIILDTGWTERWQAPESVFETDKNGILLHPGFSEAAVMWLIGERGIRIIGTDAPGIDPGKSQDFIAGKAVANAGCWHLENVRLNSQLPRRHFQLSISPLPLVGGHGSPCVVYAIE